MFRFPATCVCGANSKLRLCVTFVDKENRGHILAAISGDSILDIALANGLDMEGACGGTCACSTCHIVVLDEEAYAKMPEPEDDEYDMLDLASGLTRTSRLGCRLRVTKEQTGIMVGLPNMTRSL